ncbi:hypothetical protein [Streptomyces manipurensis]|uniref:hypothetical protein n=2 Tax=Streptomyces TaxID=1883 RepID=UPI003C6EDC6E
MQTHLMHRPATRPRIRAMRFGLYADPQGLAWVEGLVARAAEGRRARIVAVDTVRTYPHSGRATAELYEDLAEQWAFEHPGEDSGGREAVELRVRLECSRRTWRAIRRRVLATLCPQGTAPHTCRVPWCGV